MEDFEKTKKAALRLLAIRPRSKNELRQRLGQKKLPGGAIDRVVEELTRVRMLDDEAFARLYVLSRMQNRASGKGLVRRELAQKGIPPAVAARAMEAVADFDEETLALELAKNRLASMKDALNWFMPAPVNKSEGSSCGINESLGNTLCSRFWKNSRYACLNSATFTYSSSTTPNNLFNTLNVTSALKPRRSSTPRRRRVFASFKASFMDARRFLANSSASVSSSRSTMRTGIAGSQARGAMRW